MDVIPDNNHSKLGKKYLRPYAISATNHIGPKVYKVGFVVGCFCLYPSCSEGLLFRMFMTKIKRIKIR